jgi:hypothetical protein
MQGIGIQDEKKHKTLLNGCREQHRAKQEPRARRSPPAPPLAPLSYLSLSAPAHQPSLPHLSLPLKPGHRNS